MSRNLFDMMCLDIYLNGLNSEQYNKIKESLKPSEVIPPLLCWEFFYPAYQLRLKEAKIKTDLRALRKLSLQYSWNINLNRILNNYPYDALVVTDNTHKIIWVNNGFFDMTGYSKSEAIDKKPTFLQGKETSLQTKEKIREHLIMNKQVKDVLVNYRKDGTPYRCELNIFPITGNGSSHFLALERAN